MSLLSAFEQFYIKIKENRWYWLFSIFCRFSLAYAFIVAEVLSLLIENYENEHYPIDAPDPIEAIKIRMEELNMRQKDLVGIIGGKSRVSEILNRKKKIDRRYDTGIGADSSNLSFCFNN